MDEKLYKVERPIYTFDELSEKYPQEKVSFNLLKSIKHKTKMTKPSLATVIFHIFPFPIIMSRFYNYKFIIYDIVAGITMLVFHLPQGMAYGLLAGLKPINGLYTSFYPPLIYSIFGTSRHLSMGTFSMMALLSSVPVIREAQALNFLKNETSNVTNNNNFLSDYDNSKLQISIATTLLAGILQLIMGICRLGYIMNYASDALIGGFTCAISFHVIASQLAEILGYSVKRYSRAGELPYKLFLFAIGLTKIHWVTFGISVSCVMILVIFTELITPLIQKKVKFPFPIQLIIIIIGTVISYYCSFNRRYSVAIVGHIPKGLPGPIVPNVSIWPRITSDAIMLAIVGFVMNGALSKLYALKFNYDINYNQESIAYGLSNIFGSFFQCTMSAGALARSSVVVQVGMKSQLASLISCVLMMFVLLFIGPLFEHVPTCVLSSIIVVSLKGMVMQIKELPELYKLSKQDFVVWVISFSATLFLNVPYGAMTGFICSLLTIIARIQNPEFHTLGQLPQTNIYKSTKFYKAATELHGVKIFQFNGPLYFANAEYFHTKLFKMCKVNPFKLNKHSKIGDNGSTRNATETSLVDKEMTKDDAENDTKTMILNNTTLSVHEELNFIIIDCSAIIYMDKVAIRILDDIYNAYDKIGIHILLAGPNYHVQKLLVKSKFAKDDLKRIMFVTVHDAVLRTHLDRNYVEKA